MFLALGLLVVVLTRMPADTAAQSFAKGVSELAYTAMLIGFARAIALILEDGGVLYTIVHGMSVPLALMGTEFSVIGMLIMQSVMNFFIPSGSGQAYVTMPLMAPMSDILGISRQTAVLAYQFGDGFTNMIVPTNPVLMGILGVAGIPYDRWLRFIVPLMIKIMLCCAGILLFALWIGY